MRFYRCVFIWCCESPASILGSSLKLELAGNLWTSFFFSLFFLKILITHQKFKMSIIFFLILWFCKCHFPCLGDHLKVWFATHLRNSRLIFTTLHRVQQLEHFYTPPISMLKEKEENNRCAHRRGEHLSNRCSVHLLRPTLNPSLLKFIQTGQHLKLSKDVMNYLSIDTYLTIHMYV